MSNIIDEARNLFFPQGGSTFGRWLEVDYDLANFNGEKIDKLITPEGKEIEFSLQSYFQSPVSENQKKRTSIRGDESRRVALRGEKFQAFRKLARTGPTQRDAR